MKQVFKIYIHRNTNLWSTEKLMVSGCDLSNMDGYILLGSHEVELEIPDVDETALMVANLQGKITKVRAESEAAINALNSQIQELLAIGQEVSA